MANEIKLTYEGGLENITANVFSPAGVSREADIALSDTDHTGLYLGDCATIEPKDEIIFFYDGVYLAGATYKPETVLASDAFDNIAITEPAGLATDFREMVVQLWRRFFKKSTATSGKLKTYKDDGSAGTEQAVSFDGTTKTVGNAE